MKAWHCVSLDKTEADIAMPSRSLNPAPGEASDHLAETRFRARMARVGPALARQADRGGPGRSRGLRLGWMGWLIVDGLAALLLVTALVAWPPIQACRQQEQTVGFYPGQSIGECIHRGLAARLDKADQSVTGWLRGFGR